MTPAIKQLELFGPPPQIGAFAERRKRNPAALAGAHRVICLNTTIDTENSNAPALESLAVRRVAERFRVSIPVARVVCELAGLGVAA
jgi:hypothetical protein